MPSALKNILFLLTLQGWRNVLWLGMGMALVGVLEVMGVVSILPFIAVASRPELIEQQPQLFAVYQLVGSESPREFLGFLGMLMIILLVTSNSVTAAVNRSLFTFTHRRGHEISTALLGEYMRKPYLYFVLHNSALISKTILSQVNQVVVSVLIPSLQLIARAIVLTCMLALLMVVNPRITLIVFGGFGVCYALIFLVIRRYIIGLGQEAFRMDSDRHKTVMEALGGIKEVKIYGSEPFFLKRFLIPSALLAKHAANKETLALVPRYLLEVFAFCAMIMVVLFLLSKGQSISEALPVLALYALVATRMLPTFQHLFHNFTVIRFNAPAMVEICSVLQSQKSQTHLASLVQAPIFERQISLEQISFSYPGKTEPVLKDISLIIPARKITAFVGATGSGKSTLADIITGIITPQSGHVLIDDAPLNASNLQGWRADIGYVPQQIFLLDDTIWRNIAFGIADENIDEIAVVRAAQAAQIDEFIRAELKDGYDTIIGERGIRLSGGQRQRLGLARALYRNPRLLVLDEATSALDNVTERSVMDAIHAWSSSKTVVVIAHRLSTVQQCDQIVLLEHGKIAAVGAYEELLKSSGIFQKLTYAIGNDKTGGKDNARHDA